MKRSRVIRPLTIAVLLAAPVTALSTDVPISYLVEERPLRAAQAGDALLVEVHTNASCTALAHSEVVALEDVELLSRLKLLTPKGAPKRVKTVELRHVLSGVTPAAQLYARVVGAAIVPAGAECQAQASGVPGPAGAPGVAGPGAVLKDSAGTVIGPFEFFDNSVSAGQVYVSTPDGPLRAFATMSYIGSASDMFEYVYPTLDCTGARYTHADASSLGREVRGQVGATIYYWPRVGSPMNVQSYEFGPRTSATCVAPYTFVSPDRCCCGSPGCLTPYMVDAAPPTSISIEGLAPPFRVELQ